MGQPTPRSQRYITERTHLARSVEHYAKKHDLVLSGTIIGPCNVEGMVAMSPHYEGPLHFRDKEGRLVATLGISARRESAGLDSLEKLTLTLHQANAEDFVGELRSKLTDNAPPYASWEVEAFRYFLQQEPVPYQNYRKPAEEHDLKAHDVLMVPWDDSQAPVEDSPLLVLYHDQEGFLVAEARFSVSEGVTLCRFSADDEERIAKWRREYGDPQFKRVGGQVRASGKSRSYRRSLIIHPRSPDGLTDSFLATFPQSWEGNPTKHTDLSKLEEVTLAEVTHFLVLNYGKFE